MNIPEELFEIIDPKTERRFYINILSGNCYGEMPENSYVKDKDPNMEEWWELFDTRHSLV
jgi:hypothetical protein